MDAFGYLSVLLSIIVGLGVTQLLSALGRLIRARAHVRFDWPPLLAALVLFVGLVQFWWASFGLRDHARWTFAGFFMVILQSVLLYMAAALVLPESVAEPSDDAAGARATPEVADLRAHYERQAPWVFGFLVAVLVASVLKDLVLDGRLPARGNLLFHAVLLAAFLLGALARGRRVHVALGLANAGLLVAYIATLFAELR